MIRALALAALLAGSFVAGARDAEAQNAAAREACKGDYGKYCASVSPGGGRIVKCLTDNRDKLSEACKAALDGHKK